MPKRAYSGSYYSSAKRGRYTRRRRFGRRMYARPSRRYVRRRYTRKPKPEVKTYDGNVSNVTFTLSGEPTNSNATYNPPWNSLERGTANNQRIGNLIGPCVMQLRYAIDLESPSALDQFDQCGFVRVIVLQMKGSRFSANQTGAPPTSPYFMQAQDLFPHAVDAQNAHLMTLKDGISSVARIYMDKLHKLDFSSSTSSIIQRLRFNIPNIRWLVEENETGEVMSANPVIVYFIGSKATQNAEPILLRVNLLTTLRYYDC